MSVKGCYAGTNGNNNDNRNMHDVDVDQLINVGFICLNVYGSKLVK